MHLLSDATYELLVDFEVTKASNSEVKETEKYSCYSRTKYLLEKYRVKTTA